MHDRKRSVAWSAAVVAVLGLVLLTQPAQAQTFTVLHNFTEGQDGAHPGAGLTMDKAGNLYGTASGGGDVGAGTVFKLSPKGSGWVMTPLYDFQGGNDGVLPAARVIFGPDNTLYGTTAQGGGSGCGVGCGTVFNLKPPPHASTTVLGGWVETVLYRFTGTGGDGSEPLYGDLVFDPKGKLYGTTNTGGIVGGSCFTLGCGVVFMLTPSNGNWTESTIWRFTFGNDGAFPQSGVTLDRDGNLYGTNSEAMNNTGVVYELMPAGPFWVEQTLHAFTGGADGGSARGGLIFDPSGTLYGTTAEGGSGNGGTVFSLTPSNGDWAFKVLYNFVGGAGGGPNAALVRDSSGSLYGTTAGGGAYGQGSVFRLTPSNGAWTYTSLHDFTHGNDGALIYGGLLLDANGNVYGTAAVGGSHNYGVVFEITP